MNELLSDTRSDGEADPLGSLVDADMAAYYHWINQQRLPGYDRATFVVWFEGHKQAMAIGPATPRRRRILRRPFRLEVVAIHEFLGTDAEAPAQGE